MSDQQAMKEALDSFFGEFGTPLMSLAAKEYAKHGRGILLVGFNRELAGPMAGYVPLKTAKKAGYSEEMIRAIRNYNPVSEVVLYVNCGDHARLLRMQLEKGPAVDPAMN